MDVTELVRAALGDPGTGWSMGAPGAIAEFVRTPGEPAEITDGTVVTGRGAVRVTLPAQVRALAYLTPVGPDRHWNHAVALCVPATGPALPVLTELGPDVDAIRPDNQGAVLFDLGLGLPGVDACVRTADPDLLTHLRGAVGRPLFDPGSSIAARLVAAAPHRVFSTACGRVEVYATIPAPDGRSPDGPHTHLLPDVLLKGRTHAATIPVPAGLVPVAHLYPPSPLTEPDGTPIPYSPARAAAFDELLAVFGDPGQRAVTAAVRAAVAAGDSPSTIGTTAPERAAVAVALRRLAHEGADPAAVRRWRTRSPLPELDPDGDRNAG